jgi:glycosyltransferase involved in cell wall biosynthesis
MEPAPEALEELRALVIVSASVASASRTGVEQRRHLLIEGTRHVIPSCVVLVTRPLSEDQRARMAETYGVPVLDLGSPTPTSRARLRERIVSAWKPRRVSISLASGLRAALAACPQPFDLVMVEAVEAYDAVRASTSGQVVVDLDDLASTVLAQELRVQWPGLSVAVVSSLRRVSALAVEWARWSIWERHLLRSPATVLVCSEEDAALIRARGVDVQVVPNGFDLPEGGSPDRPTNRPPTVAFWGLMAYRPNADGARWLVHEVLPHLKRLLPDVVVRIIGSGGQELGLPQSSEVEVLGFVEDLEAPLATVDVAVVPLRIGGGTRIKIIEAWARRIPVVSTTVGARGLGAHDGRELLIADDTRLFAEAIERLVRDEGLRGRIVEEGAMRAASMTWAEAEGRLRRVLGDVLAQRRTSVHR